MSDSVCQDCSRASTGKCWRHPYYGVGNVTVTSSPLEVVIHRLDRVIVLLESIDAKRDILALGDVDPG